MEGTVVKRLVEAGGRSPDKSNTCLTRARAIVALWCVNKPLQGNVTDGTLHIYLMTHDFDEIESKKYESSQMIDDHIDKLSPKDEHKIFSHSISSLTYYLSDKNLQ